MAITRALEFDQTPNRMLFEIGEQARQQQLMQQKLQQENQEKQLDVLQQINPAALYPKFEKEVVDQSVGELTAGMANYIKQNPNASYIDLQNMVNQNLGQIARWSAGVKSIKDNIDKSISLRDSKDPYDKGRLRALSIDRALYNTDEYGRKVLKGADEFDFDSDIISQVIADNEDKLIDPFKGQQAMVDVVNSSKEYSKDINSTIETPDGRKTVVIGQKSSVPFFLEAKDGELRVKQQPNGYIDEGVYERFYQDPSIRANINANAKSNMKKIGVPESPEAFEYFKRAYLTTWLEGNKKGSIEKVDKTLYQKPTAEVTVNVGGAQPYRKAFAELKKNVIGDDFVSGKLSDTSPSILEYITSIANKQGKRAKVGIKYTISDLDVRVDYYGNLKIYDKSSNEEILTLNEKDFDQEYNKSAFGAQAAGNASGVNWK